MKKRNFSEWIATMRDSINEYTYYIDFPSIYEKLDKNRMEISILGALLGSHDIKKLFLTIMREYPEALQHIPLLLASQSSRIYAQDNLGGFSYDFKSLNQTEEQYLYFMEKTGLFELLSERLIQNIYDYCLGVSVGLDVTNRHNRGVVQLQHIVERFLEMEGVTYYQKRYLSEIQDSCNADLSAIVAKTSPIIKWDFVVEKSDMVYIIATDFANAEDSNIETLNQTSLFYKMIAEEARSIPGVQFVWITDGAGWRSAARNLEETFRVMDTLYNIRDLEQGALARLFAE